MVSVGVIEGWRSVTGISVGEHKKQDNEPSVYTRYGTSISTHNREEAIHCMMINNECGGC